MAIIPAQLVDCHERRVLTDDGKPGIDGVEERGSTTEAMKCRVAAAIYANCKQLNDNQLDEIISWVRLYKTKD